MPPSKGSPKFYINIPPPPSNRAQYKSFTHGEYRPFNDETHNTIDRILSEADLKSGQEAFPEHNDYMPEGSSSEPSNHSVSHGNDGSISKSRYFEPSARRKVAPKKQPVATRTITVVDIASDTETSEVGEDVHDYGGLEEGKCFAHQNLDGSGDLGRDTADSPDSEPPGNFLDDSDAADEAEEDSIFAAMDEPKRALICHFIASHPFMRAAAQPVQLSDRRDFSSEICTKALSEGMEKENLVRFVAYVRRMYLYHAGVPTPALSNELVKDMPWGDEVNGNKGVPPHRKHRQQSLGSSEPKHPKRQKTTKIPSSQSSINLEEHATQTSAFPQSPSTARMNGGHIMGKNPSVSRDQIELPEEQKGEVSIDKNASDHPDVITSDTPEFQDSHEFLKNNGDTVSGSSSLEDSPTGPIAKTTSSVSERRHMPTKGPGSQSPWHPQKENSHASTLVSTPSTERSNITPSTNSMLSCQRKSPPDQYSTPSKSSNPKYPPLSPDPAEWDLDF